MNILLICAAGMSTSLLVQSMEQSALQKGIDVKIWAVSMEEARANVQDADVVLLGPQLRYKLRQFQQIAEEQGVPLHVIDPIDYGMINGENVLNFAISVQSQLQEEEKMLID